MTKNESYPEKVFEIFEETLGLTQFFEQESLTSFQTALESIDRFWQTRDRLKAVVRIWFGLMGQARQYRVSWEEIAKWLEQVSEENYINPHTLSQSDSEVSLEFSKDKQHSAQSSQPPNADRPQTFHQQSNRPNADRPQTSQTNPAIEIPDQPGPLTELQPELPSAGAEGTSLPRRPGKRNSPQLDPVHVARQTNALRCQPVISLTTSCCRVNGWHSLRGDKQTKS